MKDIIFALDSGVGLNSATQVGSKGNQLHDKQLEVGNSNTEELYKKRSKFTDSQIIDTLR